MAIHAGDWCYSLTHDEPCRVVGVDAVWGEQTAQVWLARRDAMVPIRLDSLQQEETAWRQGLAEREAALPDLMPLLLVAIVAEGAS